ncbi:MAG: aldolase/citrate lyase family protein [Acidobacteriota bacterium]
MRSNKTLALLRSGEPALGLWAQAGSPALTEAATTLDLDWLLLDFEHGFGSAHEALSLVQAGHGNRGPDDGPTLLARIPSAEPVAIKKLLDLGVEGILAPQIRTAKEAADIVAACNYPPKGKRGIGPSRATGYFSDSADYFARCNDEILVGVQIETREAIDDLDAIAAVEGLDLLLVGPADLSAAFGHFLDPRNEEVEALVDRVVAVCREHGKAAGYFCTSGKEAAERLAQGFQVANVTTDLGGFLGAVRSQLKAARE